MTTENDTENDTETERDESLCKWCPALAVAGCDDQCEHCYAENSLSQDGSY